MRESRVSMLPSTGALSVWGFSILLKGTSAVLQKCPGPGPATAAISGKKKKKNVKSGDAGD